VRDTRQQGEGAGKQLQVELPVGQRRQRLQNCRMNFQHAGVGVCSQVDADVAGWYPHAQAGIDAAGGGVVGVQRTGARAQPQQAVAVAAAPPAHRGRRRLLLHDLRVRGHPTGRTCAATKYRNGGPSHGVANQATM
jgi:hypothetical protein